MFATIGANNLIYCKLTYPIKLGASICTVQRYCENMIYCKAIQYFGSF